MRRIITIGAWLMIAATAPLLGFGTAEEGTETLSVAMSGNPDTLDPQASPATLTFQVTRSIFDTLVEPDEDGEIVPALAHDWDVNDEATEWTFYLEEEVVFHNGDAFTADDVVATFDRMFSDEVSAPNRDDFGPLERVERIDDYTVRFHMEEPFAPLLSGLGSGWAAILPESLIEEDHDFGVAPVGTGPFRFVDWVRDSRVMLARHERYWQDDLPRLSELRFNIVVEPSVQLQGLLTGQFHVIDIVNPEDRQRIEDAEQARLDESLSSLVMVMSMNTRREPFDDVDVRRAITHAINKQQVLDIAYGGGEVGGTFLDTGDPVHRDFSDRYPYDPDRARELLANSNVTLEEEIVITVPQNYDPHVTAAQLYQQMLEDVGFNINLNLVEWSTWLSDVYGGGNFDLTVIGHTGKLDPDGRFGEMTGDDSYTGWSNERFRTLVREARATADPDERQELYEEAQEILAEQVPKVFTGTNYRYIGLRESVSGFHMDSKLDTYDFRRITIE